MKSPEEYARLAEVQVHWAETNAMHPDQRVILIGSIYAQLAIASALIGEKQTEEPPERLSVSES